MDSCKPRGRAANHAENHHVHGNDIDGDGFDDFAADFWTSQQRSGFVIYGGHPWERTLSVSLPIEQALIITAYPNPCNDYSTVVIEGSDRSPSDVLVYDVLGREVRRLRAQTGSGTSTRIVWDGRDSRGLPVPPGPYNILTRTTNVILKGRILKR